MLRVVLLAEGDERNQITARAVKMLGPKVIGYNPVEGWLIVSKVEADAIVKALRVDGIIAETRLIPRS